MTSIKIDTKGKKRSIDVEFEGGGENEKNDETHIKQQKHLPETILNRVIVDLARSDVMFHKSKEFINAVTQHLSARHIIDFLQRSQESLSGKESLKLAELSLTKLLSMTDRSSLDLQHLQSMMTQLLSSTTTTFSNATNTTTTTTSAILLQKNDAVRRKKDTKEKHPIIGRFIKMSTSQPTKAIVKWKMTDNKSSMISMKKELILVSDLIKIGIWSS
jgi:hypothetical protein